MRIAPRHHRSAFTLLEVLLASVIALLLTAALYTALNIELQRTEDGRTAVEQATVIRSVINRLTADIAPSLTQINGKAQTASTTTSADSELAALAQIIGTNVSFQTGIIGSSSSITVFITRLPESLTSESEDPTEATSTTDLRRVTYWVADGGLAREQVIWLTSEEAQAGGLVSEDGNTDFVIAPEVTGIQFQYWDGTAWQDSWDGSQLGPDGATPLGPPRAIAVTLQIIMPGLTNNDSNTRTVRHVIAVPSAAGPAYAGQPSAEGATP